METLDIIGWIATALVIFSFMINDMLRLRFVNLIGAAFWLAYGIIDLSQNIVDDFANPLNNAGIRRGEVLYTSAIALIIYLTTSHQELDSINSDCIYLINQEGCIVLDDATFLFNLIFLSLRMLVVYFVVLLFYNKLNLLQKILLSNFIFISFPYTNKDFLTYLFLFMIMKVS